MAEPTPVRVPVETRFRDLDAMGHVNNAVYLTYFEQARMAYVRRLAPADAQQGGETPLPRDYEFILAEVTCRYRSPALLSDRLVVEIYVSQVGRKSFVFEYRIRDDNSGRLVADGCSTQVWYDYRSRQSRPLPETVIGQMEALQNAPLARAA